jgi:carboxymethylenebutenolidase
MEATALVANRTAHMPVYQPDHVEYAIVSGRIRIAMENGQQLPAYWSHPSIGDVFPGIVLIHDWWGITDVERHLANLFAQVGYYVIVPDLYDGQIAMTPQQAMTLLEHLGDSAYPRVDTALQVLERHHRCNRNVAAIGLGMGGSFAYEAAIERSDLEAAVSYYGFPQRYFGRLSGAKAPIIAFYGSGEPHVSEQHIARLRRELAQSTLKHEVHIMDGAGRDFFSPNLALEAQEKTTKEIWRQTLVFLDQHLVTTKRAVKKAY